ncbi:hypothetical protein KC361_g252 [Hortaea werneckii]|nr:hypothetical protein KC361_g252 [Hortaea werneckii]
MPLLAWAQPLTTPPFLGLSGGQKRAKLPSDCSSGRRKQRPQRGTGTPIAFFLSSCRCSAAVYWWMNRLFGASRRIGTGEAKGARLA